MKRAVLMIVMLLVIGAAASLVTERGRVWLTDQFDHLLGHSPPTASDVSESRARIVGNQPGASFASVAAAAKPAVVNVIATHKITLPPSLGLLPGAPGGRGEDNEDSPGVPGNSSGTGSNRSLKGRTLASGFAIRRDGTIVTSSHAVEHAERVTVRFGADPTPHDARVLGTDPATDLALLKVSDAGSTPSLSFAEPGTTQAGDWVVAIGNPFGLEQTLTAGIVSATDRTIGNGPYGDLLQINASVNPGDSGGPLLNVAGEVVGINSAIFREGGSDVGIAFALPADIGKGLVEQLEKNGRVVRPWLGVTVQNLNGGLAKALDIEKGAGVAVSDVRLGGPAAAAGIERGDVIVSCGKDKIRSARDLSRRVAAASVGSSVEISLVHDGKPRKVAAKLTEMPQQMDDGQMPQRLSIGGSMVQTAAHSDDAGAFAPASRWAT